MNHFPKVLALGALIAAAVPQASATPISQITLTGAGMSVGSTGFDFTSDPTVTTNGTGIFTPFTSAAVDLLPTTVPTGEITYAVPVGGELLFSIKQGSDTLSFTALSETTTTPGKYVFYGNVNDDGVIYNGTVNLNYISADPPLGTTYTETLTVTPEPNSLMLLGTGLFATCGMLCRRSRIATV